MVHYVDLNSDHLVDLIVCLPYALNGCAVLISTDEGGWVIESALQTPLNIPSRDPTYTDDVKLRGYILTDVDHDGEEDIVFIEW